MIFTVALPETSGISGLDIDILDIVCRLMLYLWPCNGARVRTLIVFLTVKQENRYTNFYVKCPGTIGIGTELLGISGLGLEPIGLSTFLSPLPG